MLGERKPGGWHLQRLLGERDGPAHQCEPGLPEACPELSDRIPDVHGRMIVDLRERRRRAVRPRDVAELGEIARHQGAGADVVGVGDLDGPVERFVGDVDAGPLAALHVQRVGQMGQRRRGETRQATGAAEGHGPGEVDLRLGQVADPVLRHAELRDQQRQQRLGRAGAHVGQHDLACVTDRGHQGLSTHPRAHQPGAGYPRAQVFVLPRTRAPRRAPGPASALRRSRRCLSSARARARTRCPDWPPRCRGEVARTRRSRLPHHASDDGDALLGQHRAASSGSLAATRRRNARWVSPRARSSRTARRIVACAWATSTPPATRRRRTTSMSRGWMR